MRLIFAVTFLSLCFLSCNSGTNDRSRDTSIAVSPKDTAEILKNTAGVLKGSAGKLYYIIRGRLDMPDHSAFLVSRYVFPMGSLEHDSSFYFKANYITVARKPGKIVDSIQVDIDDLSNCRTCSVVLKDLTEKLKIQPLFIQLVTPGLDLTRNTFIGYRGGKLHELFHLDDTEEGGVDLKKTDDSTLSGLTFGIDEAVGVVGHNFPVRIDLPTFTVSHPLPDKQYIGFKTDVTEDFKAHRVINGEVSSLLVSVKAGDSVLVDTFYRSRQKVRLLVFDWIMVETKLKTTQMKVRHAPAAG
ncbi:MAG TPA: hypothetical protein VGN00_04285 [Puia sp.]|jgi:hypothetical protein